MDPDKHELEYLAQGYWHNFKFRLGNVDGLDRAKKEIHVAPTCDDDGVEIIPRRTIRYDTLIFSVGSNTNDFNVPGARDFSIALDTQEQAAKFHTRLHNACIRANTQDRPVQPGQLDVAIVGGGATGVELSAELHNTTRELAAYGLERIDPDKDIRISLIEAGPRLLPALPVELSSNVELELRKLKVHVYTNERVTEVGAKGVSTSTGRFIPAEIVVWAAGIKAPDFLKEIDGLETNWINQLVVEQTLQTTRDENIFALGDCAACPWPGHEENVPPRAQSAHQQASLMVKTMKARLAGKPLPKYVYKDYGSLVNLSGYTTVGNLMGSLKGSVFIEGLIARTMYKALYKMHLMALHGFWTVVLKTIARFIAHRTEPHIKLH
jgi:NADH dehydrogenase